MRAAMEDLLLAKPFAVILIRGRKPPPSCLLVMVCGAADVDARSLLSGRDPDPGATLESLTVHAISQCDSLTADL